MKLIRIFSLLLLCFMSFSMFGCEKIDLSGGNSKDQTQNDPVSDDSDPNTLIVKTTVSGSETFRPEGGASPKTDRILAKIAETEEQFGITVEVEIVSEESLTTAFLRACRAENKYADIIQTNAAFLSRYYDEGYFLSLSEAGLEASSSGSLKKSDGTAYALRADGWNNPLPTLSYVLFYNEKLLLDSGCETPEELYEAGAWNWINFEKLCNQITRANPGEVYALAHPTQAEPELVWASLHAAGVIYFTDDGTCIMDSEEGLDGFSALQSLLSSGVTYRLGSYENSSADPTARLAFTNRRTAFLVGNSALLFESGDDSLSENLGEDLRLIGFPTVKKGISNALFSKDDIFCGITFKANTELCKSALPVLFGETGETDAEKELIETYFYHEADGDLYFDLLETAETDTSLAMTDNRSLVEEYFVQIAQGNLSAKEYLNNLQIIFNATSD